VADTAAPVLPANPAGGPIVSPAPTALSLGSAPVHGGAAPEAATPDGRSLPSPAATAVDPFGSAPALVPAPDFSRAQPAVAPPDRVKTLEAPAGLAGGGSGSGVAASAPAPPPGAVTAVLVILLCLSTALFGRLVLASARWRPVAFVSLLERPG
jgi:hypothetical protein